MKALAKLLLRVAELERRVANTMRHGPVVEVDPKKQVVRLGIGEDDNGQPVPGPWVPYGQIAGAMKVHTPPSVGQNMTMFSPTGDFRQAVAMPFTWSDENGSPSEKGDEHVATFGDFKAEIRGNELVITVPRIFFKCEGSTFELTGGGLKMVAPDYEFE